MRAAYLIAILAVFIQGTVSYDFGECEALRDPIGFKEDVDKAGYLEIDNDGGVVVVRPVCDENQGWVLAHQRFAEIRCEFDELMKVWRWSHQHRDQPHPPKIICSKFSPRPIKQTYTIKGCPPRSTDLVQQVGSELGASLACAKSGECELQAVELSEVRDDGSCKVSVVVSSEMSASLSAQKSMLERAAETLKEYRVSHPIKVDRIGKRDLSFDFNDTDPDNSTTTDCGDGQITETTTDDQGNDTTICVDCTAGTFANTTIEKCTECPYDTYSNETRNSVCESCEAGSGTLDTGSADESECTAVCEVQPVLRTASLAPSPGSRVLEGGKVTVTCADGYLYGQQGSRSVACRSHLPYNNFLGTCRKIDLVSSSNYTHLPLNSNLTLSCVVEPAQDPQHADNGTIVWWSGNRSHSDTQRKVEITDFNPHGPSTYRCSVENNQLNITFMSPGVVLSLFEGPQLTPSGDLLQTVVGHRAELTCSFSPSNADYLFKSVKWSINSTEVTSDIRTDTNSSISTLTLDPKVLEKDVLDYICEVTYTDLQTNNTDKTMSSSTKVAVHGWEEELNDAVLTETEIQNTDLACRFYSANSTQPNTIINWFHFDPDCIDTNNTNSTPCGVDITKYSSVNGTLSRLNLGQLNAANVTSTVRGRYECRVDFVTTSFGSDYINVSSVAMVKVIDSTIFVKGPEDALYAVGLNNYEFMKCQVTNPYPSSNTSLRVLWLEDGIPVADDKYGFDPDTGEASLYLNKLGLSSTGNTERRLGCMAEFVIDGVKLSLNSSEGTVYVTELVEESPEYTLLVVPFNNNNSSQNNTHNDSISQKFSCSYKGSTSKFLNVTWEYKDQPLEDRFTQLNSSRSDDTYTYSIEMHNISSSDSGWIRCILHFDIGPSSIPEARDSMSSETKLVVRSLQELPRVTKAGTDSHTITCRYSGSDPVSVTWSVDDDVIQGGDPDYETGTLDGNDEYLKLKGLSYSDAPKNVSCIYSFADPPDTMMTSTSLVYRGIYKNLDPNYYYTPDSEEITMQCSIGVGSDGEPPNNTEWYISYSGGMVLPVSTFFDYTNGTYSYNITTASAGGLFSTTLVMRGGGMTAPLPNATYSCQFTFSDGDLFRSSAELHLRYPSVVTPRPGEVYQLYSPLFFPLVCMIMRTDDGPMGVHWYKDNGDKIDGDLIEEGIKEGVAYSAYNMSLPTVEDSGAYRCSYSFSDSPDISVTTGEAIFRDITISNPARVYVPTSTHSPNQVNLECVVESTSMVALGWFEVDYMDYITPTSLEFSNATNTTTASLMLPIEAKYDAGNFKCVKSELEYSRQNVTVVVFELTYNFSQISVREKGEPVVLGCFAEHDGNIEAPTVNWYRRTQSEGNFTKMNETDSTVTSNGTRLESTVEVMVDDGQEHEEYYCEALYDKVSGNRSQVTSLATRIMISKIEAEEHYKVAGVHADMSFTCHAFSQSKEQIYWRVTLENGTLIDLSGQSEMVSTEEEYLSTSVLQLSVSSQNASSDKIECWFGGDNGTAVKSDSATLNVIVMETQSVEVLEGTEAELSCKATPTFDIQFSYIWSGPNVTEEQATSNSTTLAVSGFRDMEYMCYAVPRDPSVVGNASQIASCNVFSISVLPRLTVEVDDEVSLNCTIDGESGTPSFNWYKEGAQNDSLSQNESLVFTPQSWLESGLYYCEVEMEFDGVSRGPFKSNGSQVIVRDLTPSFKKTTLIKNGTSYLSLSCEYGGDDSVDSVRWKTPNGTFQNSERGYEIATSDYEDGVITSNLQVRRNHHQMGVYNYGCIFEIKDEDSHLSRNTTVLSYAITTLPHNLYNPNALSTRFECRLQPDMIWTVDSQVVTNDTNNTSGFTPVKWGAWFRLNIDLSGYELGMKPKHVAGKFVFDSETVGFDSNMNYVFSYVYKRDFVETIPPEMNVIEDSKSFRCAAGGDDNDLNFTWYILQHRDDEADLVYVYLDTLDPDVTIIDEVLIPDVSKVSTLNIANINSSPKYNGYLWCYVKWNKINHPDTFQFYGTTTGLLNTIGAFMESESFMRNDGSGVLECSTWGKDRPDNVTWYEVDGDEKTEIVHDGSEVIISEQVKNRINRIYTLTFTSLTKQGSYMCQVDFDANYTKTFTTYLYDIGASFEPESPYFVRDLKKRVEFTCNYRGSTQPSSVVWFNVTEGGDVELTVGDRLTIDTSTYDPEFHRQESKIVFLERGVYVSGRYGCQWNTKDMAVREEMVVAVRNLQAESELVYYNNKELAITCHYTGLAEGQVLWYFSPTGSDPDRQMLIQSEYYVESELVNNTQILTLQIPYLPDVFPDSYWIGRFICKLRFAEDGDALSASTQVEIRSADIISPYSFKENGTAIPVIYVDKEENKLSMSCLLANDVLAKSVDWYSDSGMIRPDNVKRIVATSMSYTDRHTIRYYSNITLIGDAYSEGRYSCKVRFEDGSDLVASAYAVSVAVNPGKQCNFIDYKDNSTLDSTLKCSFEGDVGQVEKYPHVSSWTLPDSSSVDTSDHTEKDGDLWVVGYDLGAGVSSQDDGVYRCGFRFGENEQPEFTADQRVTARRAQVTASSQSPVVGCTVTLRCYLDGGAQHIYWYKNSIRLQVPKVRNTTRNSKGLINYQVISIKQETAGPAEYSCEGKLFEQFCPGDNKFVFRSDNVTVKVGEAVPVTEPQDGYAVEGDSHSFTCQFRGLVEDGVYNPYNVNWYFNNTKVYSDGDYYEDGERVIDGEILTQENATTQIIQSVYRINGVTGKASGTFSCKAVWSSGVFIESRDASLWIISVYIHHTNSVIHVARDRPAKLTCIGTKISGQDPSLEFYSTSANDTVLSNVVQDGNVAVLTVNATDDSYFCRGTWNSSSVVAQSDVASLSILRTYSSKNLTEQWGVVGGRVVFECLSDAYLLCKGEPCRDEWGRKVMVPATTQWKYHQTGHSDWSDITDLSYFEGGSIIGPDGLRRSSLYVTPDAALYEDMSFKCDITFISGELQGYTVFGGVVSSAPQVLKLAQILKFAADPSNDLVVGDEIEFECIVVSKDTPNIRLTNDGMELDNWRYDIINQTGNQSDLVHSANFTIRTKQPTVLHGGQDFSCSVSFNGYSSVLESDAAKVVVYYDCSEETISVLGKKPDRMTVNYTTGTKVGDITAYATCPADTDDKKYTRHSTTSAGINSTCSRDTGRFYPRYLATCLPISAIVTSKTTQTWNLATTGFTVCDDSSVGEYTIQNMTDKLTTDSDVCGPYAVVPCLSDDQHSGTCTLVVDKTGCSWNDATKRLKIFYTVELTPPVWTIQEKRKLADLPSGGKVQFWGCQGNNLLKRSRGGKLLSSMVADIDSDEVSVVEKSKSWVLAGVAGVAVLLAALATILYKRYTPRRNERAEVIGSFEMKDRSTVIINSNTASASM